MIGGDVAQPLFAAHHVLRHHLAVDEALVHQEVDALSPSHEVVTHRGVARERDPAVGGLEKKPEGRPERPVVDREGGNPHARLVENRAFLELDDLEIERRG